MKLSAREINLIFDIAKSRKQRQIGAWLGLVTALVAFAGVLYFDIASETLSPITGIFLGIAVTTLSAEYFGIRAQDKLIDLLQRYVNNDPEAIQQLSSRPGSSEIAA